MLRGGTTLALALPNPTAWPELLPQGAPSPPTFAGVWLWGVHHPNMGPAPT